MFGTEIKFLSVREAEAVGHFVVCGQCSPITNAPQAPYSAFGSPVKHSGSAAHEGLETDANRNGDAVELAVDELIGFEQHIGARDAFEGEILGNADDGGVGKGSMRGVTRLRRRAVRVLPQSAKVC